MERLKALCVVMAVLMCVGSSLAVVATRPTGGDWMDPANWNAGDIANDPGDDVYTEYTGWNRYQVLAEGDTTACRNLYFSLYNYMSPGFIQIDGTLNSSLHLIYGQWGSQTTAANAGSIFKVTATGVANFNGNLQDAIAPTGFTQTIDVQGVLNIAGDAKATTAIDILLSGNGSMTVGGDILTGLNMTFDFADAATLTAKTASFDALMAAGDITSAEGTVGMLVDNGDGTAVYGIVPEPATMALLGLGALVLRRKK